MTHLRRATKGIHRIDIPIRRTMMMYTHQGQAFYTGLQDTRMAVMMVGETYFQQRQRNSPGLLPVINSMSSENLWRP